MAHLSCSPAAGNETTCKIYYKLQSGVLFIFAQGEGKGSFFSRDFVPWARPDELHTSMDRELPEDAQDTSDH